MFGWVSQSTHTACFKAPLLWNSTATWRGQKNPAALCPPSCSTSGNATRGSGLNNRNQERRKNDNNTNKNYYNLNSVNTHTLNIHSVFYPKAIYRWDFEKSKPAITNGVAAENTSKQTRIRDASHLIFTPNAASDDEQLGTKETHWLQQQRAGVI